MNVIRALTAVIGAVLRAAAESFLGLASMLVTALVVLAVVGAVAFGLSGMVGPRLGWRRRPARDKPPARDDRPARERRPGRERRPARDKRLWRK